VSELQPIDPRVRSRAASGAVACASAGLGIAVASTWMCAEELASGALVEVLADYRIDPIAAFVVFPAGRRPSQKARAFSDYLEQALSTLSHDRPSA
jgi:DNA-binding transcriptional LysR family regulator